MKIMYDYHDMFMQRALSLARKGWGKTAINPFVGALVVVNNRIVGQGFHRKIGDAHAEVCALIDAGMKARDATLYVNMEPCCCSGHTPPCVEAILRADIKKVVIGMIDPNPIVKGNGIALLKQNGIDVILNVLSEEAHKLNRWYTKYITTRNPYIFLKIAVSSNGKISGFQEKYITSVQSRMFVHSLRGQVSAILIGINTVLADNPYLTDRLVGRTNPARVVIDPHLKIPLESNFLKPDSRRIIITNTDNDVYKIEKLIALGVEVVLFEGHRYSLQNLLKKLGTLQIGSVLVEGGGSIFAQFYNEKLYDELYLFQAPKKSENGIELSNNIIEEIRSMAPIPIKIGEDTLYHVYRNY